MTNSPQDDFQARLNRINTAHQDAAEERQQHRQDKAGLLGHDSRARYVLALLGALVSGVLVLFIVRYVRMQLIGDLNTSSVSSILTDLAISLAVSWAIRNALQLKDPEYNAAQSIGVTLMAFGMHNLAFWAPGPMAALLSPTWVYHQQQNGVPNSLLVAGQYIPLTWGAPAHDPAEPELPAVVYRN